MGYLNERTDRNGNPRYTVVLPRCPRGALRSAGTYSSKKDADKAWQKAEAKLAEGRIADPRRGDRPSIATSPRGLPHQSWR